MNILLVEPDYYSKFPPLGLLKLASYHKSRGDEVKLIRGRRKNLDFLPDKIAITSLFTYAWKPVHKTILFYKKQFPRVNIEVGGIYASILPNHIKSMIPKIKIHTGLFEPAERYLPAYEILIQVEKWKEWNSSILFSSRGCIRKCPFCIVPKLEGKIKPVINDIYNFIYSNHKKVIFWDNNFLASPTWKDITKELIKMDIIVDFNQGLDARLINDEKAKLLSKLRIPLVRMAYDHPGQKKAISKAIQKLSKNGVRKRNIFIYTLYNYSNGSNKKGDTPESFLKRVNEILKLGCVSYPMRYEPITSLKKNHFVSPHWTENQLELIAKARRVIGFGGAFPPYKALIDKFINASNFTEAFSLRPENEQNAVAMNVSGK